MAEARLAFLLALSDRLRPLVDPEDIGYEAACVVGEFVGANRVGYAEDTGDGVHLRVNRHYSRGVASLEGRHRYDQYGGGLLAALAAGRTVVVEDCANDPHLDDAARAAHAALHIGAKIVVPLVKAGRLVALLFLHFPEPRTWPPREIALVEDVAARTWEAIERARAVHALGASERKYRNLFEHMNEGFALCQLVRGEAGIPVDFRVLEVNPAIERHTGLRPGGLVGRLIGELFPREVGTYAARYGRMVETGEPLSHEVWVDELGRWLSIRAFPQDGDRFAFLLADITERKRVEEALRASEERLRLVVENSPDSLVVLDRELRYVWAMNPTRIWRGEEYLGKTDLDLMEDPEDAHVLADIKRAVLHENRGRKCELALSIFGERRHFAVTYEPWRDPAGAPVGILGYVRDITEQVRTEQALKDADRRKDEFLATLAHELRNPLAPLRTAAHLLNAPDLPERQRADARAMIERQVTTMTRLVDDLLDVSRVTLGRIVLQREPVSVRVAVQQAVEAATPAITARGHQLRVEIPEPPPWVNADLTRLAQVLTNLLANAAKYTPTGGRLLVHVEATDGEVVVRVRDSGVGIPREMLGRVFEMFAQVPRSREMSQGGLGIGLALAKRLVEMHDGTIEATSEGEGRGSEFVVRLARVANPQAAAEIHAAPSTRPGRGRVLIVDDNEDAAQSLAMLLDLQGHDVTAVHSGEAGLAAVQRSRYDAVVLDIGLPQMDGYEVARRIRDLAGAAPPLLVALTGWGQQADRARAASAGFDAHLTKPADPDQLARILADGLGAGAVRH